VCGGARAGTAAGVGAGAGAHRGEQRGLAAELGELEVRPVTTLLGHAQSVTDTLFSNRGDRILTGSMDDGTARIWSWGPKFTNIDHLVLKVCREAVQGGG
ncbi:unnamed protein product, partial [Discosporangium mesarthrocarpum]